MISDFDRSLGSRYFLNVAKERTCFASYASAFKSSGLITCLEYTTVSLETYLSTHSIHDGWVRCSFILRASKRPEPKILHPKNNTWHQNLLPKNIIVTYKM